MQDILVIRFGALGDLCLLGWTLARLAAAPECQRRRVTLVTKSHLADLAARLTGVDRVIPLAEPGRLTDLLRLSRTLRDQTWDTVIDAHGVTRSRLLTTLLGRAPHTRLRKDTLARLRLLRSGSAGVTLTRHMRDRFDELLPAAGLPAGQATPPLAELSTPSTERVAIGLAPGAQWDSKRWPQHHWTALVGLLRQHTAAPIRVLVGPREDSWFGGSPLEAYLESTRGVDIIRGRSVVDVARALSGCRALVCNDSGLMHLAEAVGTPVVAFFGPTVAEFGYTPHLPASRVLDVPDLACRPCSRNGKRRCHRGDLACLESIAPEQAWSALLEFGPWEVV